MVSVLAHVCTPPLDSGGDDVALEVSGARLLPARRRDPQTRFGLYESIREYAREKFEAPADQHGAFERHATYFLKLGQGLSATAESSKSQLDLLDLERDNLSVVFARALATRGQGGRALQATLALDPLLALRGPYQVHLQMLDEGLQKLGDAPRLRAAGLEARVRARQARGRMAEAEADCLEVLALSQQLVDRGLEGRAELYLGLIDRVKGQRGDARRRLTRAIGLLKIVGDRRTSGRALSNMAVLLHEMGHEPEALEAYNQALEVHREVLDRLYEGVTLANLGVQQQALGLLKPAKANYQAALGIHRELGNRRSEGISHINLGDLSADLEQPGQSRAHYESALAILREVGARRFEGVALCSLASLHLQYGELEDAEHRYQQSIALLHEVQDQRYEGLAQAGLAAVEALKQHLAAAEERMAEATRLLTESGDASFLDTLDLYRAHLELGHALLTKSEHQAAVLEDRVRKRIAHAEKPGEPDDAHPGGGPSPAARSEHVRAALRSLKGALVDCGKDP
jgi:tetratricopeptide (TPR) repeat protein